MSTHCAAWPPNRSASARSVTALCVLLAVGCSDEGHRLGGGQEAARKEGSHVGTCEAGADLEIIDQMEDGDGTIEMTAMRGGVWFSFNDKQGGTQTPDPYAEVFPMAELDPPRAGSHYAARTRGGGFTDWGAGIGFELYNQKAYDVSRYAGITFWARRAPDTVSKLRFAVTDSATAPRGGQCHEYADYSTCSDYFGSDLSLDTEFQRYTLTWGELTQSGFGDPRPDSVNTSAVYGVRFQIDKDEDFDFWIDDIALLCRED